MEFIKFIFSSFWVWLGFTIIILATLNGIVDIVKAIKEPNKVNKTERKQESYVSTKNY